jgi:hypothetical protein
MRCYLQNTHCLLHLPGQMSLIVLVPVKFNLIITYQIKNKISCTACYNWNEKAHHLHLKTSVCSCSWYDPHPITIMLQTAKLTLYLSVACQSATNSTTATDGTNYQLHDDLQLTAQTISCMMICNWRYKLSVAWRSATDGTNYQLHDDLQLMVSTMKKLVCRSC